MPMRIDAVPGEALVAAGLLVDHAEQILKIASQPEFGATFSLLGVRLEGAGQGMDQCGFHLMAAFLSLGVDSMSWMNRV